MINAISVVVLVVGLIVISPSAQALHARELLRACAGEIQNCAQKPFVQTYLGGMLDALGYQNGENKRFGLPPLYCKSEKTLFDMQKILEFAAAQPEKFQSKNMTASVLLYFEVNGGCKT